MLIPGLILIIIVVGLFEKVKIFDLFIDGTKEAINMVLNLFPTFLGLFLAVNLMRSSGLLEYIANLFGKILFFIKFPKEIITLVLMKPVSGSASIAIFTNLLQEYKENLQIGYIAAIIMGSTETTLYALSVYTGKLNKKVSKKVILLAIAGNTLAVLLSIIIGNMFF